MATLLREDMKELRKDLLALRDELRLKMHLANMDLKSEWERLEPQAEKVWSEVSDASLQAAKDLQKRFLAIREQLKKS